MEELLTQLQSHGTQRTFKKRSMILYQGEIPQYAYIILRGVVKTYSLSSGGDEQIIRLLTKYDLFTIPWLFERSNRALYYYEAHTDCTVLCVNKTVFLEQLEKHPQLQRALLSHFATLYTGSMVHITSLEQARAQEKILNILYYLCLTSGAEFKPGKFKVELHLTHSIIASLSGLTRETAALELGKLKRKKIIKYTARYYLIDKVQIEALLGEDISLNLQVE